MDSKVVSCKDFGKINVQEYTTVGQLNKYYSTARNDFTIAADKLISDIIIDNIEEKKLTDADKINILYQKNLK